MEDQSDLGRRLIDAGLVTDEQLQKAEVYRTSTGGALGAILVKLGFLKDEQLVDFTAKDQYLDVAELDDLIIPENLVKRIPEEMIQKYQVIPIAFKDGVLTLATSDPMDFTAIDAIQLATNYKVELALASSASIQRTIHRIFEEEDASLEEKSKDDLLRELEEDEAAGFGGGPADDLGSDHFLRALVPLLIEKGVISRDELEAKAMDLGL